MSARILKVYVSENGQIWAEDEANQVAYRLQHAVSSTDYPAAPAPTEIAGVSLTTESRDSLKTTELNVDPLGGDLIAKSIVGPNAGKSANLTYGKWA